MQTQVLSVSIPASRQWLVNYRSDIHNLSALATECCLGLEQVAGHALTDLIHQETEKQQRKDNAAL